MQWGLKWKWPFAVILAVGLAGAAMPAAAEDEGLSDQARKEAERARDLIEQALGSLLASLKLAMDTIPQYEAPEILDNGDIIIRRKRPGSSDDEQQETGREI